jgi:general stress protein YciG
MSELNDEKPVRRRGFAAMDAAKQRAIASKGGHESGGNFAKDRARAAEAGRKGGQARSSAHRPAG